MELTFPFKNICIHSLMHFVDAYEILSYIEYKNENDPNKHLETYIGIYDSTLPNFENELLQVVSTTNQGTIDAYFKMLSDDLSYIGNRVSKENINGLLQKFNEESLKRFELETEAETAKYFESENRKRAHLEEYEGHSNTTFLLWNNFEKSQIINYNFYCIEKKPRYIEPSYLEEYHLFLIELTHKFKGIALKYGRDWYDGKIVSSVIPHIKPVIFVEGELDIDYLKKAALHLGEESLLNKIDIRQRGGFKNLDKLWGILKSDNWETVAQTKIFLYDCDTDKTNEDNLHNFRRIIPSIDHHPIKKGIENLFEETVIKWAIEHKPAMIDVTISKGTKRGEQYELLTHHIDHQEKRNFCDWICENGTKEDFKHFTSVFSIIKTIIEGDK